MSLFGAINTAVSGLSAQSASFGNISDNVANSQTVGFKEVDTSFSDFITTSTATSNDPGTVVALPNYTNNVQGTITQSEAPLALAIDGQGFFPVSQTIGNSNTGVPTFSTTPAYTRAGDFQMDKNGYLVNTGGDYLNGWSVNPTTGIVNRSSIAPIQINQTVFNPVPTGSMTLAANLPATPTAGQPVSSQVNVYDALGTAHPVILNWNQVAGSANTWTVQLVSPDDQNATPTAAVTDASGNPVIGTMDVTFGSDGTIQNIGTAVSDYGTVGSASAAVAGQPATFAFSTEFAAGTPQTITLNLGNYNQANGVTQFAGTNYTLRGINQDGVPPGGFSGVTTTSGGEIVVNYTNGQSRTIAQVPLVTFNDPNGLQRQNGQSFTATTLSGNPVTNDAGTNGAGTLVTGSIESSNVDIATQFTKLIVAQQAYSANAKSVTTANQMLQDTINMIR
jgi:flagellar hook protein FlgE